MAASERHKQMPTRRKYEKLSSLVLALDVFFFVLFYLEGTVHLQKGACGLSMIVLMQLITLVFSNTVY